LATLGYTLLFYGVAQNSMRTSYVNSVSSMSVLGVGWQPNTLLETTIAGIEAFTGPTFVALLVAYTVSIYSAYSIRRAQLDAMDVLLLGSDNGVGLLVAAAQGSEGIASLDPILGDLDCRIPGLGKDLSLGRRISRVVCSKHESPLASRCTDGSGRRRDAKLVDCWQARPTGRLHRPGFERHRPSCPALPAPCAGIARLSSASHHRASRIRLVQSNPRCRGSCGRPGPRADMAGVPVDA
jgi:hypothetical protein